MRIPLVILAGAMLLTGTLNTVATKIQDAVVVGHDAQGAPLHFFHPAFQTACMFAGEALCLIPFALQRWAARRLHAAGAAASKAAAPRRRLHRAALMFAVPTLCDACGSTLLNLGLYFTYASTFQMLRGTLVIFAGLMTIVLLRRRLHAHHWLGMVLILAGAALVGASSVIYRNADKAHGAAGLGLQRLLQRLRGAEAGCAPNPLLGDVLVVLAQLAAATQFIVEEKYLAKYQAPVLLAVGAEGSWGLAISAVALPLLATLKRPDGTPLDDVAAALREVRANWTLQWTTAATISSIGAFNFFGVSVTSRLSGAARATIDACRTLFVWLFALHAGWERFHMLQVVGFVALVSGTSLYNEILRSCLPAPERAYRPHRASSQPRRGTRGDRALRQPLLEDGTALGDATVLLEDGGVDAAPAARPAAPPTGPPAAEAAGETPPATLPPPQAPQRSPLGRPPRPEGARPITARGSANYSMARSMTILPAALSPHSLGSSWQYDPSGTIGLSDIEASYASSAGMGEASSGSSSGSGSEDEQAAQSSGQRSSSDQRGRG